MAHAKNHDYHVLPPSIWPFLGAVSAVVMLLGAVLWASPNVENNTPWVFLIGAVGVLFVMFSWWRDTVLENQAGDHTPVVRLGLRYGFITFIMSEAMLFVGVFWSFFKMRLYPMSEQSPWVDGAWPPAGITTFDPFDLPLINTLILLISGCAVTWAHHALVHENNRKDLITGLSIAVILGVIFTAFQAYEYSHASFNLSVNAAGEHSVYGGIFFMPTGLHGIHVIIGTIFLFVCLIRAIKGHFTPENHFGFEAAAWYWHFVDVVWLFLFFAVYIWGH